MSIVLPGKPDWRITIDLDTKSQTNLMIEDMTIGDAGKILGLNVRARQMNQLELAAILNNIVTSLLSQTVDVAKRIGNAKEDKTNNS